MGGSRPLSLTDSFTGQPGRNFAVVGANATIALQKESEDPSPIQRRGGPDGNYTAHYLNAGLRYVF